MLIGITGKSGSGKTCISKMLESMDDNIVALNIDEIGHLTLLNKEVQTKLVKAFGESILIDNGIDRNILGQLVFSSKEKMKILEDITWIHMRNYIDKFLKENKDKIIILEWALLPSYHYFEMCNLKIFIDASYEIRVQRAIERDNISKEKFDLREQASIDYSSYPFDYIINNIVLDDTEGMVKHIYDKSIISR